MHIEAFRDYCLGLKGVTEDFPFDEETLCFKVMGKIFALTDVDHFGSVNLKCEPDKALELRERYSAVKPGYHMNKKHWNTVLIDGSVPDNTLMEWIEHSYLMVVKTLTKKQQQHLASLI